jgi:positive regulator of sigma E activity
MGHNTKLGWIDKAAVVLTVPLTIIFVSFSSLQIIGKGNSFIDVFLACMVCLGFLISSRCSKRHFISLSNKRKIACEN